MKAGRRAYPGANSARGLDGFRQVRNLANHWERPGGGTFNRAYYWYLAFGQSQDLGELVKQCQEEIALPYYDPVPIEDLHMTLDRVGFERNTSASALEALVEGAKVACSGLPRFPVTVGRLSGTPGALGLDAEPYQAIRALHDILRSATLRAIPDAPVKGREFHAHVAIAYCNSIVSSVDAINVVERLQALPGVEVLVEEVSLVLLERRQRSYEWQTIDTVSLAVA